MSINRGVEKEDMVHTYNRELVIKKSEIMPFAATRMDLRDSHAEWGQREGQIPYLFYVGSKKWHKELIYRTGTESQM